MASYQGKHTGAVLLLGVTSLHECSVLSLQARAPWRLANSIARMVRYKCGFTADHRHSSVTMIVLFPCSVMLRIFPIESH